MVRELGGHRLAREEGAPEVALREAGHPARVLHGQRPVETLLAADAIRGLGRHPLVADPRRRDPEREIAR